MEDSHKGATFGERLAAHAREVVELAGGRHSVVLCDDTSLRLEATTAVCRALNEQGLTWGVVGSGEGFTNLDVEGGRSILVTSRDSSAIVGERANGFLWFVGELPRNKSLLAAQIQTSGSRELWTPLDEESDEAERRRLEGEVDDARANCGRLTREAAARHSRLISRAVACAPRPAPSPLAVRVARTSPFTAEEVDNAIDRLGMRGQSEGVVSKVVSGAAEVGMGLGSWVEAPGTFEAVKASLEWRAAGRLAARVLEVLSSCSTSRTTGWIRQRLGLPSRETYKVGHALEDLEREGLVEVQAETAVRGLTPRRWRRAR